MVILLIILFYLFVTPRMVYAYIDPGSGSYFIQILIGLLLGSAFTIKLYWKKIKDRFIGKNKNENKEESGVK